MLFVFTVLSKDKFHCYQKFLYARIPTTCKGNILLHETTPLLLPTLSCFSFLQHETLSLFLESVTIIITSVSISFSRWNRNEILRESSKSLETFNVYKFQNSKHNEFHHAIIRDEIVQGREKKIGSDDLITNLNFGQIHETNKDQDNERFHVVVG